MVSSLASFKIFLLILSISNTLPPVAYGMSGFSVDLHHRPSHRAIYFSDSLQNTNSSSVFASLDPDSFSTQISIKKYAYFVNMTIGYGVESVLAVLDIGGSLSWVSCHPKNDYVFNPESSFSYKDISCYNETCSADLKTGCGPNNQCKIKHYYWLNAFIEGFLAIDALSFQSKVMKKNPIPSIIFGCAHHINYGNFLPVSAVLSLGNSGYSFFNQFGSTFKRAFSYCLCSPSEPKKTSRLNFGADAVVSGTKAVTMPLFTKPKNPSYFIQLQKISVDGKGDVIVGKKMNGIEGNMIIDSTDPVTYVDREMMESLNKVVINYVKKKPVVDSVNNFSLCFSGIMLKLPPITFHFSGGATIFQDINFGFIRRGRMRCLPVKPLDEPEIYVLGTLLQVNHHFGFDLHSMKLTVAPTDCSKI